MPTDNLRTLFLKCAGSKNALNLLKNGENSPENFGKKMRMCTTQWGPQCHRNHRVHHFWGGPEERKGPHCRSCFHRKATKRNAHFAPYLPPRWHIFFWCGINFQVYYFQVIIQVHYFQVVLSKYIRKRDYRHRRQLSPPPSLRRNWSRRRRRCPRLLRNNGRKVS